MPDTRHHFCLIFFPWVPKSPFLRMRITKRLTILTGWRFFSLYTGIFTAELYVLQYKYKYTLSVTNSIPFLLSLTMAHVNLNSKTESGVFTFKDSCLNVSYASFS